MYAIRSYYASPDEIARTAREKGCRSVALTYSDPVVFFEYALDTARVARKAGLKTAWITAGYINPVITSYSIHYTKLYDPWRPSSPYAGSFPSPLRPRAIASEASTRRDDSPGPS